MIRKLFAVLILGLATSVANAATTWQPTSEDTDFFTVLDFADVNIGDAELFMFDNDDAFDITNGLAISDGGYVTFTPPPPATGDIIAASYDMNDVFIADITLSANNYFKLAVTRDGGTSWIADTGWDQIGADSYMIEFNTPTGCGAHGQGEMECRTKASIVAIDLQPIPVPAAVWLFGSGLLGLAAVARRRAA